MNWVDYLIIFFAFLIFIVPALLFWAIVIYFLFIGKDNTTIPLTEKEEIDARSRAYDRINH